MTAPLTILGAGVAGLAVAAELAARGARPHVVDPAGTPGPHGCSWWAGGMLAPDCEAETAPEPVARLGRGAAEWWQAMGAEVVRAGTLVVALGRDRAALDRFARRTAGHVALDRAGLARLEPQLAERFDRALHFPDEAHLDPRRALSALRTRLAARGIEVVPEAPAAPAAGRLIDCRGLAAADRLPGLRGVRGEMALLDAPEMRLGRPVRLLHPRHPLYVVPRGEGRYMIGATQVETADAGPVRLRGAAELFAAAHALDPAFAEARVLELGAGARPAFPDNLPRVLERGGRLHVNGLFRHGFLMAPALARQAADLVFDAPIPEECHEDLRQ
ncbi:FAD-dependent oxidoreductase [Roseivivax sp. CAU 1761]